METITQTSVWALGAFTMTDDIKWQDPPPPRSRKYKAFYEQLKANPGKWAIFPGSTSQSSNLVLQGFERAMRDDVIYLRWPAPDEAAEALE